MLASTRFPQKNRIIEAQTGPTTRFMTVFFFTRFVLMMTSSRID